MRFFKAVFLVCFMVFFPPAGHPATYYVSPRGNDGASGLAPEKAWRTVRRVNQTVFTSGDKILLEGGATFRGPVKFDRNDSGLPDVPIVLGTYRLNEAGKATIAAGRGRGIDAYNVSGLHIRDLVIAGDGADSNSQSGIIVLSSGNGGIASIRIENVEVHGFGKYGISLGAWKTASGCKDVLITHCSTHDNLRAGIFTWGPWGPGVYAHRGIHISDCLTYGMKGGSGITLSSVDGGIVERCVAHDNGAEFSGAAGIWAWDSNNIVLQFNESYGNRTIGVDGDGFDFDGGVTNSVMQYNYSHDNDAAGFLLAQYAFAPQAMHNIVIRYNISENDCRKNAYGAIHVWNGESTNRINGVQIYQNTIYLSASPNKKTAGIPSPVQTALKALGLLPETRDEPSAIAVISPTKGISVHNNLFYTSGGGMLVAVVDKQDEIKFQNNAYWSGDAPFRVDWMGEHYQGLNDWLAAAGDQEKLGSRVLAINLDPMLVAPGSGGVLGHPRLLQTLTGYKLKSGSPLVGRGINLLSSYGIDPGSHGFFGNSVSKGASPAIGAHLANETPMSEQDRISVSEKARGETQL